jgi:hypothetical protein
MLSWTVVTKSLVSFTALSLGAWQASSTRCWTTTSRGARLATPSAGRGPCGPRETTGR